MSNLEQVPQDIIGLWSGGTVEVLPERSLIIERDSIEITPDTLLDDNHSQQSLALTKEWREKRDGGDLIIEDPCGDARPITARPQDILRLPSIAASGSIEPFYSAYVGSQSKAIIEKPHYSKFLFVPGKIPMGCGGNGAKQTMMRDGKDSVEGDIGNYVAENIPHADVIINSIFRAQNLAQITDKPILASAQDHITGEVKPLAWFQKTPRDTIEYDTAISLNWLFSDNYDPAKIYENGIPELDRNRLPDVFQQRLNEYDKYIEQLQEEFPDLEDTQRVQNPKTIVLSTNIKPLGIRYPRIFGLPGSAFETRFGRERTEGEDSLQEDSLREGLNQTHYPILHSVLNHGDDTKDFSKTIRVLIETSDLNLSLNLACELADKPWMQKWMDLPNHKIIVAQARGGETTKAQYLT